MATFEKDVLFGTQAMLNLTADQVFRTWIQGMTDGLAAMGFVQTADTGQINPATVVSTLGSGNINRGYQIWRFNDALQATAPIFFKIEYGSQANGNGTAVWVTVGKASDGAGTLSQLVSSRWNWGNAVGQVSAYSPLLISSDGSDLMVVHTKGYQGGAPTIDTMFFIERSRNLDGTPNGDGLVWGGTGPNTNQNTALSQFISFTNQTISPAMGYWPIPFPASRISSANSGTSMTIFPMVVATPKRQGHSRLLLGVGQNDYMRGSRVTVMINGVPRTYYALVGSNNEARSIDVGRPGLLMRWE